MLRPSRHFLNTLFPDPQKKRIFWWVAGLAALFVVHTLFLSAPRDFSKKTMFTITPDTTLRDVARQLKEEDVIRSSTLLNIFVTLAGGQTSVFAGDYFIEQRKNIFQIGRIITTGDFNLIPVAITIPEGATNADIARIVGRQLETFDKETFLEIVEGKEGYLFPDTYRFLPNDEAATVVKKLEDTFDKRIAEIRSDIIRFGKPLEDVVIMASLLEKEARTTESRRIIAGILWKRIEIGMLLQVDATFVYFIGKNTFQLTLDDLAIDSPYNTYKYKGLPVGPIANPGLDSLRAAVAPIKSDYLFYLSDDEGNFHYSRTFEEHKKNKALYLN